MLSVGDVIRVLRSFDPGADGEAAKSLDLTLRLLEWGEQPFSRRTYTPGHITCTGAVLDPDRENVLLVHHRRLDRWLLPGGHVEPQDQVIWHAAQREVVEETGALLDSYPGLLVGVDVHPIPARGCEPLHLHHDLIFAFQATARRFEVSEESRDVAWCPVGDYDGFDLPGSIRRSVGRALDWL